MTTRTGTVVAPVACTEDMMAGVVSLPHGWGPPTAAAPAFRLPSSGQE